MREVLKNCRLFFVYSGVFSLVSNVLILATPLYMLQVFDRVLPSRSNESLIMLSMIFLFALAVESALQAVHSRLLVRFGDTLQRLLRKPVLGSMLVVKRQGTSDKHGLDDLNTLQSFLTGQGIKAFFDLPWIPIYLLALYLFHPLLCIIALVGALVLIGLALVEEHVAKKTQLEGNAVQRKASDFIGTALRNSEIVAALGMRENVTERWCRLSDRHLEAKAEVSKNLGKVVAVSRFVRNSLSLVGMGAAAALIINVEGMTPGIMIAASMIMQRTLSPMVTVIGAWKSCINARDAYGRLDAILADRPPPAGLTLPPPSGILSVERLLFFLTKDKEILNGIDFRLNAGESLGVVGSSASGKTSLVRLLVGIYKPSEGRACLDGADIFLWSRNGLAPYLGYLPQNVQLFDGTVAENIARMADPHRYPDEVIQAAKRARIHEMLLNLPKGYDTEIGEGGYLLSGGQRQLIGLARALYGQPKLLVLDEPSELNLMAIINELKSAGVTLVIVSHKPSVLRDVDKLLVLKDGRQLHFGPRERVMQQLKSASDSPTTHRVAQVPALKKAN
jgi:PrtD family type I secretion system ABC transporter